MTISLRSTAVFLISVAVGIALPFAITKSMRALAIGSSIQTKDGTMIQLHEAATSKDSYDLNRAMRMYTILIQQGQTGLVKPDINSRASIDVYLKNSVTDYLPTQEKQTTEPISTTDYVKPVADVVDPKDLSRQERDAIVRSQKLGKCWQYPGFSKNYYTICQKFIRGKTEVRTMGIQNDLVTSRINSRAAHSTSSVHAASAPVTVKGYDYRSSSSSAGRGR